MTAEDAPRDGAVVDVEGPKTAVCPECNERPVKLRTGKRHDGVEPGSYRCEACGATFDEPKIRDSDQVQPDSAGGLAGPGRALVEMDPDDWPPDDSGLITDGGQNAVEGEDSDALRRDPLADLLDDEWETVIKQQEPYPNRVIDESEDDSEDELVTDGGPRRYHHRVVSAPEDAAAHVGDDAATRARKDRLFEGRDWDEIRSAETTTDLDAAALVEELEGNEDGDLMTDGAGVRRADVRDSGLPRETCPVCWEPGVVAIWEPVRGFLRCLECGTGQDDSDWPPDYDYREWLRRTRSKQQLLRHATDGGSKYTVETGDGYLDVATVRRQSAEFSISSWPFDWADGTHLDARRTSAGVVLEPSSDDDEASQRCRVSSGKRRSAVLVIPGSVLDLLTVDAGDDVRAYHRESTVVIVPADPDPMVNSGADDPTPVTDGGYTEWVELTAPRRDILVAIAASDPPTGVAVREALSEWRGEDVHQGGFSRLVNDLEFQGLVESEREGKHKHYRLTDQAGELLRSRIVEAAELLDVDVGGRGGADVDDEPATNVLTDGGRDRYRCGLCGDQHETRADALICCSDRFETSSTNRPRDYRPDGGPEQRPLLDITVAKDPVAVLRADPVEHGWSIETTVENSREYIGDGVEAVTGIANCYVTNPSALRALAQDALDAADELESRGPPVTDGGEDVVGRLRELGLTERQIGVFQEGRQSVRDVFWTLDLHGELRLDDLKVELEYSDTTIHNALDFLKKGYGIVSAKQDPEDGRRTIYSVNEPENREPEQGIRTDGGRPIVTIQPARPGTDPETFLTAVEDMVDRGDVLRRDGVIIAVDRDRAAADAPATAAIGDGEELDDGGRDCSQCGGTIVTEYCIITTDDFSQIRVCTDCGAHGVRHAVFGSDIETVAGPVHNDRLAFVDWDEGDDPDREPDGEATERGVSDRG